MRLAWFNIAHDRKRFAVTVIGIMCAVFLMVFQGSVLVGFMRAASKIIDSTDADLWITGRGVQCFEFPVAIERRLEDIAHSVDGVAGTSRICTSQVQFRKPDGSHQLVLLVGVEAGSGGTLPLPRVSPGATAIEPEAVVVDSSNAAMLNVAHVPLDIELNRLRARVVGQTSGFSSFLGSPYVFTSYADAARYMQLRPEETMFVLAKLRPGVDSEAVKQGLRQRLSNVDVWTRQEFSQRARVYWITQTGAGGAILMAALLGFFIGLAIVSQAIYATTMENIEEYATLKAIGASNGFIRAIIVAQALICGVAGYALGILVTEPMIHAAQSSIPWVSTPWWLPVAAIAPSLGMCALASVMSVRTALRIEPARVFRA